jgi:hypothetical protein
MIAKNDSTLGKKYIKNQLKTMGKNTKMKKLFE